MTFQATLLQKIKSYSRLDALDDESHMDQFQNVLFVIRFKRIFDRNFCPPKVAERLGIFWNFCCVQRPRLYGKEG